MCNTEKAIDEFTSDKEEWDSFVVNGLDLKVRREMDFLYLPRGIDINVDLPVQMKTHFSLGSLMILPTTFYDNSTEVRDN